MKPYKSLTESKYRLQRYDTGKVVTGFGEYDEMMEVDGGDYVKYDDIIDLLLELLVWLRQNPDKFSSAGKSDMDLKRLLSQFMEGI